MTKKLPDLKNNILAIVMATGLIFSTFAIDEFYYGAWATEDNPAKAVVVVDPLFIWMNTNGLWRPCRITGTDSEPLGAIFTDFERNDYPRMCLLVPEKWWGKKLAAKGIAVGTNSVFLARHAEIGNCIQRSNEKRMVRCKLPDWGEIAPKSLYIGEWQAPVENMRIRINEDGMVTYWKRSADGSYEQVEKATRCWRQHGPGLLVLSPKMAKAYDSGDFNRVPKTLLWVDPAKHDTAVSIDSADRVEYATRVK